MDTVKEMKPILVVDDESIVRESIIDWLREIGYRAEPAESGEQALDMIAARDFSLLILDYRLPGKSGVDVLRAAKASKPDTKAIIITAFPSSTLNKELRDMGALGDLLVKPVATDDLEKLVMRKLSEVDVAAAQRRPVDR
jgi:DNA-binding NtrC family response regulator